MIASIIGMLLIVSGNVELNHGPHKKCPKCECSVGTRTKNVNVGMFLSSLKRTIQVYVLTCLKNV